MVSHVSLRVHSYSQAFTKYSIVPGNELQAAAPKAPALPPSSPARLDTSNIDGNYFVNCSNPDGSTSSGMAYYAKLDPGHNVGQQPNDYVDVNKNSSNMDWIQPGAVLVILYSMYPAVCAYTDLHSSRTRASRCIGPSLAAPKNT
jgi:hypothetical protein